MSYLSFQCHHHYNSGFRLDIAFESNHVVTSLFGPSGSGKTSILEMIAGLRRPDCGSIRIGDHVLLDTHNHIDLPLQQRHIGMVFQDHLLFPHFSVEKNLRYGERRRRNNGRAIEFERVVQVLDLEPLLRRKPEYISGGERQRVALGRALLSHPELLLLDEPLSALDEILKVRILSYIERVVNEWKIPTILVSHNQIEIRRLAEWVFAIEKGTIVAEGKPDDALAHPGLLAWKDSLGPVNLLRVDDLQPHGELWLGRIGNRIMTLPPIANAPTPPIYVQFSPSAVFVTRKDVTHVSARNHLVGTVKKIIDLPEAVFLAVDAGQIVWAEVTHEALADLQIAVDVEVTCLIKTHSMTVVD